MRTSIATVSMGGLLRDKLQAIAAAGFEGVELFETDVLASEEAPEEIAAMARDSGLEIVALQPSRVVVSPGPGRPEDAGVSMEVIRRLGAHVPMLGVCLGHQAIGAAFGGRVVRAPQPRHGKTSLVVHDAHLPAAGSVPDT